MSCRNEYRHGSFRGYTILDPKPQTNAKPCDSFQEKPQELIRRAAVQQQVMQALGPSANEKIFQKLG